MHASVFELPVDVTSHDSRGREPAKERTDRTRDLSVAQAEVEHRPKVDAVRVGQAGQQLDGA